MNKVLLIGRITSKPELKYSGSNIPYTRFSLAIDRPFSNANGERQTDFINVVVWRKQAENVCTYLNKGSLVAVEGRIQTGNYTDKEGVKKYTTDVSADNVQFLESKSQAQSRETSISNNNPTPYDFQTPSNDVNIENDPFADFGDSVSLDDNFLD